MKERLSGELESLLDCLVVYTKAYHKPFSKEALIVSLPIEEGVETPDLFTVKGTKGLFSRAADHAGLKTKLIKRALNKISPLQLPLILILKDHKACVLDSFSKNREELKVVTVFDNEIVETWYDFEKLDREYLGHAILLKKSFNTNTSNNKTLDVNFKTLVLGYS